MTVVVFDPSIKQWISVSKKISMWPSAFTIECHSKATNFVLVMCAK